MQPAVGDALILAAVLEPWLADLLRSSGYRVLSATTGEGASELAEGEPPDVVVLAPLLEDMSGTDACRRLRAIPTIAQRVPLLILHDGPPTPELRVAALRVGAWDFLSRSSGDQEVLLKIATYVETRRAVSDAVDDGILDPSLGLRSLPGLARRARELASLMSRVSGSLACLVIEVEGRPTIRDLYGVVARMARLSDVVGDLGASRMGVLAPGTTVAGAVRLAERIRDGIVQAIAARAAPNEGVAKVECFAGFDVVANARYHPIDPFDLLRRAATAVRQGQPVPEHDWVRRFIEPTMERRLPPVPHGVPAPSRPSADGVAS